MKKISYTTILFLLTALLCGCTEDESVGKQSRALSEITVIAGGFSPDNGVKTRTTDVEYTTAFAKNDQIGIFAVTNDGLILDDNVPYKYDGTKWVPSVETNTIHNYNYVKVTYFAYYPYAEGMGGAKNEAEIVSKFVITNDQSTQSGYAASDLMTGAGTISGAGTDTPQMVLTLKHKMSLFVMDIKSTAYVTGDGYQYSEPISNLQISVKVGSNDVTGGLYHPSTNVYRYIVPSGSTISAKISYSAGAESIAYSYTGSITPTTAGKYHLINMQRGGTTRRDLQVGDFYYQDGAILPKDSVFYSFSDNSCIGLIFKVGAYSEDVLADYGGSLEKIHGYVVSLAEAESKAWGKEGTEDTGANDYYRGYKNTQTLLQYYTGGDYAAQVADAYNNTHPIPTRASRWYLPAANQMLEAWNVRTDLDFTKVGGTVFYESGEKWYHTSTGINGGTAKILSMHAGAIGDIASRVDVAPCRPILTF